MPILGFVAINLYMSMTYICNNKFPIPEVISLIFVSLRDLLSGELLSSTLFVRTIANGAAGAVRRGYEKTRLH